MARADSPPPACLEKMEFLSLWALATRHYAQSVAESERRGDTTFEPTASAKRECEKAYKAFQDHRKKHGC
jgi:hypothetical protein